MTSEFPVFFDGKDGCLQNEFTSYLQLEDGTLITPEQRQAGYYLMLQDLENSKVADLKFEFYLEDWQKWYNSTRRFILNTSTIHVFEAFQKVISDLADDYYEPNARPSPPKKQEFVINPNAKRVSDKFSIVAVAEKYGLLVEKFKSVCPFHSDSQPSLNFYPKTNSFFCFGCRKGGDLIKFIQEMEARDGNK